MRIVFVQSGLTAGGAEKIINLLARHRADIGDEVHVLAFSGTRQNSYFSYADDIALNTMGNDNDFNGMRFARVVSRIRWLRQEFKRIRPDVIVSFLTKTNVITLTASRGLNIPVMISERNNPSKQSKSFIWQKAMWLVQPFAAGIIVQTASAGREISARMQGRTCIIPNPSMAIEGVKRPETFRNRIVATGRLSHQKGFDLLLEAFAKVAQKFPEASLTLFGEGPDRELLMNLAQALQIGNRVAFPGLTSKPGTWVGEADIFVLSSRYEGFPNVLVEALAAGLPTIAFACPWGPSDILTNEKDGLLVEPENVTALAAAMIRLLADAEQRKKLSAAAPATAQRFDLTRVLEKWDHVIDQGRLRPGNETH